MSKQFNVRLPDYAQRQINEILTATGMTVTQIMIVAIDRAHRQIVVEGVPEPMIVFHQTQEQTNEHHGA